MTALTSPRGRWWLPAFVLAGLSLVVLAVLNPHLLLSSTTPTGGDMGAHVFGPAYLRDVMLPQGRVIGWSQSWFAGFPFMYFYFPLPSLVIVFLDLFLPYGVAFKIVTVMGLLGTPLAAYFLARCLKLGKMVSLIAASSGVIFVFFESYTIYGANVASTLAGEFSFSWSFAFSLVYLGFLIKGVRDDRRHLVWAAVFLGLTALCHIITTIVIILASIPVLFWKNGRRTLLVWLGGFAVAAFWALPLIAAFGYTSDMAWTPLAKLDEILPAEIWLLLPLAIGGAVAMARRTPRIVPVITFTLLPILYYPLPSYLNENFPDIFTEPRWKLWNGRLLPYWFFGVAFLAAIAVGLVARWVVRQLPERISMWWPRVAILVTGAVAVYLVYQAESPSFLGPAVAIFTVAVLGLSLMFPGPASTRSVGVALGAAVLALGALAGVSFVDGWANWNYEGYEAKSPWPEYEGLMATLETLPPGRVLWEPDSGDDGLDKYGTPMSPMLIPYWTGEDHPSMEGLYFESSLTTPFHFIMAGEVAVNPSNPVPGLTYHNMCSGSDENLSCDISRGVDHMDLYGVRYFVSYNPEAAEAAAAEPRLRQVAESAPFTIFEMVDTPALVEPATHQPSVYAAPETGLTGKILGLVGAGSEGPTFSDVALEWYDNLDYLDRWVVAEGPESWPNIGSLTELPDESLTATDAAVTDVVIDDHRISFTTEAVGVPHLVKVSYFPNWVAEGAEGPFHAAPSLMVVVPTEENVVLEFRRGPAEVIGIALTTLALVGLVVFAVMRRRRRGSGGSSTDLSGSAEPV